MNSALMGREITQQHDMMLPKYFRKINGLISLFSFLYMVTAADVCPHLGQINLQTLPTHPWASREWHLKDESLQSVCLFNICVSAAHIWSLRVAGTIIRYFCMKTRSTNFTPTQSRESHDVIMHAR